MRYRHTQVGWLMLGILVPALLFLLTSFVLLPGGGEAVRGVVAAVLVVVGVLFSSLRTEVERGRLRVAFGPGWPSREEPLRNVAEVRRVRNPWVYGWGIRLTPHGWLWNVSGLDAVELTRRDGSRFRVGTDDPEGLLAALQAEVR